MRSYFIPIFTDQGVYPRSECLCTRTLFGYDTALLFILSIGMGLFTLLKVFNVNTRTIASDLTDQGVEIILAQEIRFLGYVPEPFLAMTQLCCLSCQLGWDCLLY